MKTQKERTTCVSLFDWFADCFTTGGKAMSLYKRGIRNAKRRNHQGAIDDYTMAIDMPQAPPNVRAMAQYDRGLVYLAMQDDLKAAQDFNRVLDMKESLVNEKTMARQAIGRLEGRSTTHGA